MKCIHCFNFIQRSGIQLHQTKECPKRPFSCEYCRDFDSTYEDITTHHWPACGHYPVQCLNRCGKSVKRQYLKIHLSNDCPLTVVDCEFSHVGCKVRLPRKNMPAHLIENVVKHLSLQTNNLKYVIDQLKKENKELKAEVARLTQSQDPQQICTPVCPPTFIMDNFEQRKRDNKVWQSTPFYTHPKGYKMCVGVHANGYGECIGTHTGVSVHLMKGEFDDQLKWPFRGQIIIRLLSQVDVDYKELKYLFTETLPHYNTISSRQLTKEIGRGLVDSVLYTKLQPKYLKNDCLKLSVHQYIQ